jgi:hypothetical protein
VEIQRLSLSKKGTKGKDLLGIFRALVDFASLLALALEVVKAIAIFLFLFFFK